MAQPPLSGIATTDKVLAKLGKIAKKKFSVRFSKIDLGKMVSINFPVALDGDVTRTFFTGVSLVLSVISLWFSRMSWLQANRPIVSAMVKTNSGGNVATIYDLVIFNTGNRPAIEISLKANDAELDAALVANPHNLVELVEVVRKCFAPSSMIPLLINGGSTSNSFGLTGRESTWHYGSSFSIEISYRTHLRSLRRNCKPLNH
jgi:hypothetical protein